MPSLALQRWFGELADALDEIENAHRAVGGSGPGRRSATQHLNQAYAVLLAAQFQGFCRELHTQCTAHLAAGVADPTLRALFRSSYLRHRMLDRGNANAENIGSDFGCFNLSFWASVDAHRSQNPRRRSLLKDMNEWRNAIAHHSFSAVMLRGGRPTLGLAQVQGWRTACDGLARSFDAVMKDHLRTLTGTAPW
jgi:hypothetical protein